MINIIAPKTYATVEFDSLNKRVLLKFTNTPSQSLSFDVKAIPQLVKAFEAVYEQSLLISESNERINDASKN